MMAKVTKSRLAKMRNCKKNAPDFEDTPPTSPTSNKTSETNFAEVIPKKGMWYVELSPLAASAPHVPFAPAKFSPSGGEDPSGLSLLANLAQPTDGTGVAKPPTPPVVNHVKHAPNGSLISFTVDSDDRRVDGLDVPVCYAPGWNVTPVVPNGVPFVPAISDSNIDLTRGRVLPMREPNHSLESIKEGDWNDDGYPYSVGLDNRWDNPCYVTNEGKPSEPDAVVADRSGNTNKVYYIPTFHPDSSDIVPDKPSVQFNPSVVAKKPNQGERDEPNSPIDESTGRFIQADGTSFRFLPNPVNVAVDTGVTEPPEAVPGCEQRCDPGLRCADHSTQGPAALPSVPYGIDDEKLHASLKKGVGDKHAQEPLLRESRRFEAEMAKLREYEAITGEIPWEHREAEYGRHRVAVQDIRLKMLNDKHRGNLPTLQTQQAPEDQQTPVRSHVTYFAKNEVVRDLTTLPPVNYSRMSFIHNISSPQQPFPEGVSQPEQMFNQPHCLGVHNVSEHDQQLQLSGVARPPQPVHPRHFPVAPSISSQQQHPSAMASPHNQKPYPHSVPPAAGSYAGLNDSSFVQGAQQQQTFCQLQLPTATEQQHPSHRQQAFHPHYPAATEFISDQHHLSLKSVSDQHLTFHQHNTEQHTCLQPFPPSSAGFSQQQHQLSTQTPRQQRTFHQTSLIAAQRSNAAQQLHPSSSQLQQQHHASLRQAAPVNASGQQLPASVAVPGQQQTSYHPHFPTSAATSAPHQSSSSQLPVSVHRAQGITGFLHSAHAQTPSAGPALGNQSIPHHGMQSQPQHQHHAMPSLAQHQLPAGIPPQQQGVSNYQFSNETGQRSAPTQLPHRTQQQQTEQTMITSTRPQLQPQLLHPPGTPGPPFQQNLTGTTGPLFQQQGVSNYHFSNAARQQFTTAQQPVAAQQQQTQQGVLTSCQSQLLQQSRGTPHHHVTCNDIAAFAQQNSTPFHGALNAALTAPGFRFGAQPGAQGNAATSPITPTNNSVTLPDILRQKSVTTSTTTASSSANGQGVQLISARTRNCDMIITLEKNGQPAFTWPVESHLSAHQDFMRTVLKIEKMVNLRDPNDAGQYFGVQAKGSSFVKRKLVFVHAMQGDHQAEQNTPENRRRWCNHIMRFWNSAEMQQQFKYPETCRYGGDITPQDENNCQPISHWLTLRDTMDYILQSYQNRYSCVADVLNEQPSILPFYYSDDLIPMVHTYYASSSGATVGGDNIDF